MIFHKKKKKKDDVNCDAWTDELQKYLKGYKDKGMLALINI